MHKIVFGFLNKHTLRVLLSLEDSLANLWAFSPQPQEGCNLIGFYQPQLILPPFPPGPSAPLISSFFLGGAIFNPPQTTPRLLPVIPDCQSQLSNLNYPARNEVFPPYFLSSSPTSVTPMSSRNAVVKMKYPFLYSSISLPQALQETQSSPLICLPLLQLIQLKTFLELTDQAEEQ